MSSEIDRRWSFWTLLIWSGVELLLVILLVPETYHPVILRNKARRLRKETGNDRWYAPLEKMDRSIALVREPYADRANESALTFRELPKTVFTSCYRPFLLLALEPMCLNLCLFSALLLGIVYLFFGAFNIVFTTNHDFNRWQVGLSFCGLLVGMLLGIATDPL